jgi:hypothetical protein
MHYVGQGYDGAANMSGHCRGVQARMKEMFPEATYVHCRCHNLNLAICDTCTIPLISNMYSIATKVLTFIRSSPKRLQVYLEQSETTRLKRFCPTRWTNHTESIHVLLENLHSILGTLDTLKGSTDNITKRDADSLSLSLCTFDFLVSMVMIEAPMQQLVPLCDSLQTEHCDLVKASSLANTIICSLKEKRNTDDYFDGLWRKASQIAEKEDIEIKKPRTCTKQTHRSNTEADTPEKYWRRNLFLPFLDHLIGQLQDRLLTPLPRLKAQYLLPGNIGHLDDNTWIAIKVFINALYISHKLNKFYLVNGRSVSLY